MMPFTAGYFDSAPPTTTGYVGSTRGTSDYIGTGYIGSGDPYGGSMRCLTNSGISTPRYSSNAGLISSSSSLVAGSSEPIVHALPSKDLKSSGRAVDHRPISREELRSRGKIVEAPAVDIVPDANPSLVHSKNTVKATLPMSRHYFPGFCSSQSDNDTNITPTGFTSRVPSGNYPGGIIGTARSIPFVSSGYCDNITPTLYAGNRWIV